MADSWEKAVSPNDQKPNLWNQILEEVSSKATRRLPQNKRVLILGDDATGKTSLVMKLRGPGEDEIKKGAGLEYSYLEVHDEERDENTRVSVWILDGDAYHKGLLNYVLTPEIMRHLLVVIVIDMSRPWTVMDSLEQWTRVIREHIHSLKMSAKELNELEANLVQEFRNYREPEDGDEEPKRRNPSSFSKSEEQETELGENVLANTLGLPIVVVCTKTDHISSLEKENDFKDEHFDFIQKNIRNFCLKYGAALVYLSVKEGKNVSTLRKYLIHRLFGFPLRIPPQVVEKDVIFIPMGWDSEKKIGILDEHINSFKSTDPFNDHIVRPILRKPANQDKEIIAEDEQTFLAAQESNLSKAPSPMAASTRPPQELIRQRIPPSGQREKRSGLPTPKPKMDSAKSAPSPNASEGVLANFFNSLLSKKPTGAPAGKGSPLSGGMDRHVTRGDPAAELEKLARAKKPSTKVTNDASGSTPT